MASELDKFEMPEIGVTPDQLSRYSNETFLYRAPSYQALGQFMRARGWVPGFKRSGPGKDSARIWHRGSPSLIRRWAQWCARDGASPGKWVVLDNPTDVETLRAAEPDQAF